MFGDCSNYDKSCAKYDTCKMRIDAGVGFYDGDTKKGIINCPYYIQKEETKQKDIKIYINDTYINETTNYHLCIDGVYGKSYLTFRITKRNPNAKKIYDLYKKCEIVKVKAILFNNNKNVISFCGYINEVGFNGYAVDIRVKEAKILNAYVVKKTTLLDEYKNIIENLRNGENEIHNRGF